MGVCVFVLSLDIKISLLNWYRKRTRITFEGTKKGF
jgi:hypothetical protein